MPLNANASMVGGRGDDLAKGDAVSKLGVREYRASTRVCVRLLRMGRGLAARLSEVHHGLRGVT